MKHKPILPSQLGYLLSGKTSKKSTQVYRVRRGRQQLYTLNHATPNSPAQLANQTIFGKVSAIVNRIFKDPKQAEIWEQIAKTEKFKTARKAAFAHYKAIIIAQQLKQQEQKKEQTQHAQTYSQNHLPALQHGTPHLTLLSSPNHHLNPTAQLNSQLLTILFITQTILHPSCQNPSTHYTPPI